RIGRRAGDERVDIRFAGGRAGPRERVNAPAHGRLAVTDLRRAVGGERFGRVVPGGMKVVHADRVPHQRVVGIPGDVARADFLRGAAGAGDGVTVRLRVARIGELADAEASVPQPRARGGADRSVADLL